MGCFRVADALAKHVRQNVFKFIIRIKNGMPLHYKIEVKKQTTYPFISLSHTTTNENKILFVSVDNKNAILKN